MPSSNSGTAVALTLAFIVASAVPSAAQQVETYPDVSASMFECIKVVSETENGTVYDPRIGDVGTATTRSTLWSVIMAYERDPATEELQYTLMHKTWIVPTGAVWDGIEDTIQRCRT